MNKPNRIPFEPSKRSKKIKEVKKQVAPTTPTPKKVSATKSNGDKAIAKPKDSLGIPDEVNRRIVRRAALFCGIPTSLGLTTFIVSYVLVSKHIVDLPTSAVVLLSMLFLGIGVVGLSYGAISASWDEGRLGSWWGGDEFKKNFGYLRSAWKSQQQTVKVSQAPKD
ncbi:MAG: DUF3464 domain-containing protein [Pseudanabaena sp.]|nr:MAG: DUF3464 domain-containing protein [Pseudanabaena sp.]